MKAWVKSIVLSVVMFSPFAYASHDIGNSPVGYWQTIDDVTSKPKAIILISEAANKTLSGQIIKIYPRPGADQNELCAACEGARHLQRIVGMTILEHLAHSQENHRQWMNGQILDPNNGKWYHCNLTQSVDGQRLNVRGFIGLPLFGRTQTWVRVS